MYVNIVIRIAFNVDIRINDSGDQQLEKTGSISQVFRDLLISRDDVVLGECEK